MSDNSEDQVSLLSYEQLPMLTIFVSIDILFPFVYYRFFIFC